MCTQCSCFYVGHRQWSISGKGLSCAITGFLHNYDASHQACCVGQKWHYTATAMGKVKGFLCCSVVRSNHFSLKL